MKIKVSNTNASGNSKTAVRVYLDGLMVGEVFPPKYNPLGYIRDHNGQYRKDLIAQCVAAGIPEKLITTELGIKG